MKKAGKLEKADVNNIPVDKYTVRWKGFDLNLAKLQKMFPADVDKWLAAPQ